MHQERVDVLSTNDDRGEEHLGAVNYEEKVEPALGPSQTRSPAPAAAPSS